MRLVPPEGSKISVITDGADPVIIVPATTGAPRRYFASLFLVFWLGAWTFGFASALSKVASGSASGFVVFWLGAWTIGGLYAVYWLYCLLRPPIAESLRLRSSSVKYDSGIEPPQVDFTNRSNGWRSPGKRTKIDLSRLQLQTLALRETDTGNRLTVDAGATRLDIAKNASEVEREWLYAVLAARYT